MIGFLFFAAAAGSMPASSKCAVLMNDYEQIQKAMASRWAESIGDNSAPRATLSEMKDNNDLIRSQISLELLRAKSCPLPDRAPWLGRYLSPALECAKARAKGQLARIDTSKLPECKMESWQPED
jgi:hypothetical protein